MTDCRQQSKEKMKIMQSEELEDFIIISDDDEPTNKRAKNEEIFKDRGLRELRLGLFINFTRVSLTAFEKYFSLSPESYWKKQKDYSKHISNLSQKKSTCWKEMTVG